MLIYSIRSIVGSCGAIFSQKIEMIQLTSLMLMSIMQKNI